MNCKSMKKIIFKYWFINLLICIVLYFSYTLVYQLTTLNIQDGHWSISDVLDLFLYILYSAVYIQGIVLCSLPIFLNIIERIRNNYFYSLLSFIGIPSICVIVFVVIIFKDKLYQNYNHVLFFVAFSIIYLFLTALEFLIFRKRLANEQYVV